MGAVLWIALALIGVMVIARIVFALRGLRMIGRPALDEFESSTAEVVPQQHLRLHTYLYRRAGLELLGGIALLTIAMKQLGLFQTRPIRKPT